jgi:3-oxoacyl-[acyl-carrier-protein] synthase-3
LIVGADKLSSIVDWEDRNTCVLFGDGAGAAIIQSVEEGYGILSEDIGADGRMGPSLCAPSCHITQEHLERRKNSKNPRTIWMDGSEVFKFAVRAIEETTNRILKNINMSIDDVKLFIPHQANIRIIEGAAKRLGIPMDKMFANIHKYGNISAASIPVALDEAVSQGRIQKGDIIVIVGFGSRTKILDALRKA